MDIPFGWLVFLTVAGIVLTLLGIAFLNRFPHLVWHFATVYIAGFLLGIAVCNWYIMILELLRNALPF